MIAFTISNPEFNKRQQFKETLKRKREEDEEYDEKQNQNKKRKIEEIKLEIEKLQQELHYVYESTDALELNVKSLVV
jgi:predicted transcriptional regulator